MQKGLPIITSIIGEALFRTLVKEEVDLGPVKLPRTSFFAMKRHYKAAKSNHYNREKGQPQYKIAALNVISKTIRKSTQNKKNVTCGCGHVTVLCSVTVFSIQVYRSKSILFEL